METAAAARIEDLETVLVWEGELDNEGIRELLGVKAVWASRLLGALTAAMGRRAKRETPYAPLKLALRSASAPRHRSPDDYLRVVAGSKDLRRRRMVEDARMDLATASPTVFAAVLKAVSTGTGLSVVYRSMSTPTGSTRLVFPHALVRAPRRWHMRAWCSERNDFRDFTLGRVASVRAAEEAAPKGRKDDEEWNAHIELELVAHPALNLEQQDMIADEYFAGSKSLRLKVRQCLAAYIVQDLRLSTDKGKQTPPDYQLLVNNSAALPPLFSTT
jgi:WYL domain